MPWDLGKGDENPRKRILSMAKTQGHVSNSDILQTCYGFKQTIFTRGIKFDRQHIGLDRYLSASVAVARSLNRLRGRGLMIRGEGYHVLTKQGHETVDLSPP